MRAGFLGTFVISLSQTKIDGMKPRDLSSVQVGLAWSWNGDAVRVDGPTSILRLEQAGDYSDIRRRAARVVRRLVGAAFNEQPGQFEMDRDDPLMDCGFVLSDGTDTYIATLIQTAHQRQPLFMFLDELPPKGRDLWIVHESVSRAAVGQVTAKNGGVICFTPGTYIATPDGPKQVQDLQQGDRVLTKDSGAQDIQWVGSRFMSGARLHALPHLRPIRISVGAFGIDRPDQTLRVSPDHRLLIKGRQTQDLFNTDEVLVRAKDMINDHSVTVDCSSTTVTYIHLLLPKHEIIWANGIETESFHPAFTLLSDLSDADRKGLLDLLPALGHDPQSYGAPARRALAKDETALLNFRAA